MGRAGTLALLAGLMGAGWAAYHVLMQAGPISARVCEPVPPAMVAVPGGRFVMGGDHYPEETRKEVVVSPFQISRTEVTNDEFAEFVAATGYVTRAEKGADPKLYPGAPPELLKAGAAVFTPPEKITSLADETQWWRFVEGANWRAPEGPGSSIDGKGDYPVVAIALEDAQAYAAWKGHRLPSEAQWEWAARGADPNAQPTDTATPPAEANTWQGVFPVYNKTDDGFDRAAPVGCFAPNPLGLYDMIGNVWEWTVEPYGANRNVFTIKGGSYLCAANYCARYRPEARQPLEADFPTNHTGFRTVRPTPPAQ